MFVGVFGSGGIASCIDSAISQGFVVASNENRLWSCNMCHQRHVGDGAKVLRRKELQQDPLWVPPFIWVEYASTPILSKPVSADYRPDHSLSQTDGTT